MFCCVLKLEILSIFSPAYFKLLQSTLIAKKATHTLLTLPHVILAVGAGISCSGRAPLLLAMCTTFTHRVLFCINVYSSYYVHCVLGALATGARASLGNIPLTNHLSCKGTVAAIYGFQRGTFVEAEADLVPAGQ